MRSIPRSSFDGVVGPERGRARGRKWQPSGREAPFPEPRRRGSRSPLRCGVSAPDVRFARLPRQPSRERSSAQRLSSADRMPTCMGATDFPEQAVNRRVRYDLFYFSRGISERRNHSDRRKTNERRADWARISSWSSIRSWRLRHKNVKSKKE